MIQRTSRKKSKTRKKTFSHNYNKKDNIMIIGADSFIGKPMIEAVTISNKNAIAIPSNDEKIDYNKIFSKQKEKIYSVIYIDGKSSFCGKTISETLQTYRLKNCYQALDLIKAAKENNVKRFIYLSSAKIEKRIESIHPNEALKQITNNLDAYLFSKYEAEVKLTIFAQKNGIELTIIRAPLIYGPNVKGNFLALMNLIYKGFPLPFGSLKNKVSLIYVKNLCDAFVKVINKPEAHGKIFTVSDKKPVRVSYLIKYLIKSLNSSSILIPIPKFILNLIAKIFDNEAKAKKLMDRFIINNCKIYDDIGWEPPFSVFEGLEETSDWYKEKIKSKLAK
jgi:nucleoside-diphosphate-sugar epimerase